MKKIICSVCAILTIMSIMSLCSCSSTKQKLVGTYDLVSIKTDESTETEELLNFYKNLGLTATLEIRDDNTAELNVFGQKSEMTYNLNKMIFTIDGKNKKFKFDGSKLTIGDSDTNMVFVKRD